MSAADSVTQFWTWAFLIVFISLLILLGALGQRRVHGSDDFATARGSYGPLVLALAFASTTASGATFLGLPALAYSHGLPAFWVGIIYPLSIYGGVLLCMRAVARYGNRLRARSIPEYLGERYQSDTLRIVSSVFSLALIFFLAAQIVAGLAMFEMLLGLPKLYALLITATVLTVYVVLGGAHADILTDSVQALIMVVISLIVTGMFLLAVGFEGGVAGMLGALGDINVNFMKPLDPTVPIVSSVWALVAMFCAYLPFGLLPHIGNKLWALKDPRDQRRFLLFAFLITLAFPIVTVGGLHARVILGDALFTDGLSPNAALPALLLALVPGWIAALLAAGILASIMSTADGLVISTSQVFANDLYRRSLERGTTIDKAQFDRTVLLIGRISMIGIMIGATVLAWYTASINVVLLTWFGIGGMVAALAGPLVLGTFWRGVTRSGAIAGFVTGAASFIVLHAGWIPADTGWVVVNWLATQAPNPYACAALGELVSLVATVLVSLLTPRLSAAELQHVFGEAGT